MSKLIIAEKPSVANQTEVGNLAYPQRGLEAQGGNRKSAAHGNFSPAKQSDDHRVPL